MGVGSVAGGGRYDNLVGMFDPKGRKVKEMSIICYLPRFNGPLFNEVLGIKNNTLQPRQSYSKMYGTEPRYNEILVITNTIEKLKRKIYSDMTNEKSLTLATRE